MHVWVWSSALELPLKALKMLVFFWVLTSLKRTQAPNSIRTRPAKLNAAPHKNIRAQSQSKSCVTRVFLSRSSRPKVIPFLVQAIISLFADKTLRLLSQTAHPVYLAFALYLLLFASESHTCFGNLEQSWKTFGNLVFPTRLTQERRVWSPSS